MVQGHDQEISTYNGQQMQATLVKPAQSPGYLRLVKSGLDLVDSKKVYLLFWVEPMLPIPTI